MRLGSSFRASALLSTAIATSLLAAGSAAAQTAPAPTPAPATAVADAPAPSPADSAAQTPSAPLPSERLVAMSGTIRPFAGGILPYAGNIRSFAGDVSGSAGNIRSFSGNATASAGNIRSFAGNIRSFAGNIRSFSGDVLPVTGPDSTFWGGIYPARGALSASAGNIRSFAGQFEGMAGNIRSFAGNIRSFDGGLLDWTSGATNYQAIDGQIAGLVAGSKTAWGAAVQARTGQSFEDGFANKMLGKYGIDLNDAQSLVGLDEVGYELFLMDWYDGLMNYSGVDQVDHWMKAINWSPRITQDLGSGKDSRIGLLDFTVTGEGTSSVVMAGGVSKVSGVHGSAVISLMTAAHDGRGVMGIAPGASVVAYNPFDETYTAGWTDIKNGVINLVKNGATIINMSLGVPGYTLNPGWNTVFSDDAVSKEAKKRVFVLAAGNEGITQTQDIQWAFDKNPAILVVGSVDPNGTISEFSNRPGNVCLTKDGKMAGDGSCTGKDRATLASRFIVAPGEFILVADGQGGVTRMSGTSFAAPLVSGTVALIHDRWPWLRDRPADTADLVLSSARDVGAPGTDPVYGRGMLDVAAALSPGSLAALKFKISINGSKLGDVWMATIPAVQRSQMLTYWEANNAYVTAFEDTLTSYRDFSIPLSSKLAGQTVGNSTEQFNSYLTARFLDWFKSGGTTTPTGKAGPGFAFGAARFSTEMRGFGGMEATMTASPKPYRPGLRQSGVGFETGLALHNPNSGIGVRFGTGRGAAALGQQGFGMQSDYETETGGANPFLGFASGTGYAAVDVDLSERLTLSSGVSRQEAVRDFDRMGAAERVALGGIDPYRATANTLSLRYSATPWLTTTLGYTMLNEATGLLGVQSLDPSDLRHGSATDAATFGADVAIGGTLSVSATGTLGRTRGGDPAREAIAVSQGGVVSSAYQAAITKVGVFGNDRMRVTLSQPIHIERGSIEVSNVQVIDRQAGELGNVVQRFDIAGSDRRYVAEVLYGRTLMGGIAELNLFGRVNVQGRANVGQPGVTAGTSFRLGF
ncbi:S8 family serine peptidase [Sphingomonas sp.]|uniref:S8 family serine peptidase n=1 Tax=Sphingomonas sp. TaxID=28214 RepID=UPI0035BBB250